MKNIYTTLIIHSFIQDIPIVRQAHHSSPPLLRGAPVTARLLCWNFTPKRHRQQRVTDLPKVIYIQCSSERFHKLTDYCYYFSTLPLLLLLLLPLLLLLLLLLLTTTTTSTTSTTTTTTTAAASSAATQTTATTR